MEPATPAGRLLSWKDWLAGPFSIGVFPFLVMGWPRLPGGRTFGWCTPCYVGTL